MEGLNDTIETPIGKLTRRYAWLEDRYYYVSTQRNRYFWGPTAEEVYRLGLENAEKIFLDNLKEQDGQKLGR